MGSGLLSRYDCRSLTDGGAGVSFPVPSDGFKVNQSARQCGAAPDDGRTEGLETERRECEDPCIHWSEERVREGCCCEAAERDQC